MDFQTPMGGQQRQVSFGEAIQMGFSKYVTFSGRSSRSEYWWWCLFAFIVNCVCSMFDMALDNAAVSTIVGLALLLPGLAVACRRLHDIGKAAGYIFLVLIPLVGAIILIVWYCKPSEPSANRFGEVPNEN